MRLKDVRMANGASVLAHWRANHPGAVVSRDQYMVREVTSGVMIPVQFLKVVQLPSFKRIKSNRNRSRGSEMFAELTLKSTSSMMGTL
ncbi:unnamed protein product [Caenorhabditis nigoni]